MIEQFSPTTRRVIAIALLALAIISLLSFIVGPVTTSLIEASSRLQDARFQLARLAAVAARPIPPVRRPLPLNAVLTALDEHEAQQRFLMVLTSIANRENLEIAELSANPDTPLLQHQIAVKLVVTGTEAGIVRFVDAVEAGPPFTRFRNWRIVSMDNQSAKIRFEGTAIVAWERGR